jgi:hypothetical protein
MYFVEKEKGIEYDEISIDNKTFYKLREVPKKRKSVQIGRKRYSDQFKDPVFLQKDAYRKLKMIEGFRKKNGNLDELIERWRSCVEMSIDILRSEYSYPVKEMFRLFNLKKYGFRVADYGMSEDEAEDSG